MSENLSFEEWSKSLENMDFDHYSLEIKNKILESNDMDDLSKRYFSDCFDYVYKLYKNNKQLDMHLLKIYLEEVKGYKNIKLSEIIPMLILLGYCGFDLSYIK